MSVTTTIGSVLQAGESFSRTLGAVLVYTVAIAGLLGAFYFLWGVVHALWKEGKEAGSTGSTSQASSGWVYDEDGKVLRFKGPGRLARIDQMSGQQFERRVGEVLRGRGYEVEQKGGVGDFGADMIASRGGRRYVVQAKRRAPDSKIGPKVVRATIGAREHFGCSRAMVVTNCQFSGRAEQQAGRACRLVDRTELAEWMRQI